MKRTKQIVPSQCSCNQLHWDTHFQREGTKSPNKDRHRSQFSAHWHNFLSILGVIAWSLKGRNNYYCESEQIFLSKFGIKNQLLFRRASSLSSCHVCLFNRPGPQCYDDLIVVINHMWALHMQRTPNNVTSSCTVLTANDVTVKR